MLQPSESLGSVRKYPQEFVSRPQKSALALPFQTHFSFIHLWKPRIPISPGSRRSRWRSFIPLNSWNGDRCGSPNLHLLLTHLHTSPSPEIWDGSTFRGTGSMERAKPAACDPQASRENITWQGCLLLINNMKNKKSLFFFFCATQWQKFGCWKQVEISFLVFPHFAQILVGI